MNLLPEVEEVQDPDPITQQIKLAQVALYTPSSQLRELIPIQETWIQKPHSAFHSPAEPILQQKQQLGRKWTTCPLRGISLVQDRKTGPENQ